MRVLFLHDNFPAQFGIFGQYLSRKGWDVAFGTARKNSALPGINVFNYEPHRKVSDKIHPYAATFERAVLTGQAVARAGIELKNRGYAPDIVVAHSGWGPGLFVKDVWPEAKFVGYFEWFYNRDAPDVVFMNDASAQEPDALLRSRSRNAPILMDLANSDAALCPTAFQKAQFPSCFDDLVQVMHDGIDTDFYEPNPTAKLILPDLDLSDVRELITYVARGMEPYRGFPEFIDALKIILNERPDAHAVIVGEDRVAYGKKLPDGDSFKKRVMAAVDLDWARVHFTGLLPRNQYRQVVQASTVHVYLTVPFVLSWSMMESMSMGAAIVASDVEPVREIAEHDPSALTLAAHNAEAVAQATLVLLDDPERRERQSAAARQVILTHYAAEDLYRQKEKLLESLVG